jgi:hypothetical protein
MAPLTIRAAARGPRQHLASVPAALFAGVEPEGEPLGRNREKIFKNLALKSMNAVRAKLREAVLYIERNPELVKSITNFPYIAKSI